MGVEVLRPSATLQIFITTAPLRSILYVTMTVALSAAVLPIVAVASTADLGRAAGIGGGGLSPPRTGSEASPGTLGVIFRPIRGSVDTDMPALVVIVATALGAVPLPTELVLAVIIHGVAGLANAYFFAATLVARSEHARQAARGRVCVLVGALKITVESPGTGPPAQ